MSTENLNVPQYSSKCNRHLLYLRIVQQRCTHLERQGMYSQAGFHAIQQVHKWPYLLIKSRQQSCYLHKHVNSREMKTCHCDVSKMYVLLRWDWYESNSIFITLLYFHQNANNMWKIINPLVAKDYKNEMIKNIHSLVIIILTFFHPSFKCSCKSGLLGWWGSSTF